MKYVHLQLTTPYSCQQTKNAATSTPKKTAGDGSVAKTPVSSRKKGTAKKRSKAVADEDDGSAGESVAKKTKVKSEPIGNVNGEEGDELS